MESSSLTNILYEQTVEFIPNVTEAKVIKVYDGDTITIGFYMEGVPTPYRLPVRLLGIDTPEMKGSSAEEKQKAKLAQQFLSSRILGKIITLQDVCKEKYGRLLANVYCEGEHINQLMIDSNHAIAYFGGTKKAFGSSA